MAKFGNDSKFGTGKDETDEVSQKLSEFINQYDEVIVEGEFEADIVTRVLGYRKKIINAKERDNVFNILRMLYKSELKHRVLLIISGEQEGIDGIVERLQNEMGIPVKSIDPPLIRVNDYIDILVMGLPEKGYRGCTESVIGRILEIEVQGDCENDKRALREYVCGGPCENED